MTRVVEKVIEVVIDAAVASAVAFLIILGCLALLGLFMASFEFFVWVLPTVLPGVSQAVLIILLSMVPPIFAVAVFVAVLKEDDVGSGQI